MKVKPTLSPTATWTQRWGTALPPGTRIDRLAPATIPVRAGRKESPFDLLIKIVSKPLRIPVPVISTHPFLRGKKSFLRAFRATGPDSWHASARFPVA